MENLWAWAAIAGLGALHGLNPATGWGFAAAWGVRARDRRQALRALLSLAAGHALSVGAVVLAVRGATVDRVWLQCLAGVLLAVLAVAHLGCGTAWRTRVPAGHLGLALWSFLVSSAHGAGLMLVPALLPLCMGDPAAGWLGASGTVLAALAAVCVHMAALLAVSGAMALAACRGWDVGAHLFRINDARLDARHGLAHPVNEIDARDATYSGPPSHRHHEAAR